MQPAENSLIKKKAIILGEREMRCKRVKSFDSDWDNMCAVE